MGNSSGGKEVFPKRSSGIILHPTSLPSSYGIGDFGPDAYRFVDFLADTGQTYWQILPLNPTDLYMGNSPYMSISAFAMNPILISPEILYQWGLLSPEHLDPSKHLSSPRGNKVNYSEVTAYKREVLERAFERFAQGNFPQLKEEFERFKSEEASWLEDYSLFTALLEKYQRPWNQWDEGLRRRDPEALALSREHLKERVEFHAFTQFLLRKQWYNLRAYMKAKGVEVIGDIPIYVSYNSADVWANQELFLLDEEGNPRVVAGVPPDAFSATGQLWGNPIYNWEKMRENGYAWWEARFRAIYKLVDVVRIDHFRGFVQYWEIPAGSPTAVNGRWVDGPGEELFRTLESKLGYLRVIVEDLGIITPDVVALREKLGFPGMKVLVFAFDDKKPDNPYKPHNYEVNCVVYTGTHDNAPVRGWYKDLSTEIRSEVIKYIGRDPGLEEIHWEFIRLAMSSVALLSMYQMQDVLGLGNESRMNYPSKNEGNWEWRMRWEQITDQVKYKLAEMTWVYGRWKEG